MMTDPITACAELKGLQFWGFTFFRVNNSLMQQQADIQKGAVHSWLSEGCVEYNTISANKNPTLTKWTSIFNEKAALQTQWNGSITSWVCVDYNSPVKIAYSKWQNK